MFQLVDYDHRRWSICDSVDRLSANKALGDNIEFEELVSGKRMQLCLCSSPQLEHYHSGKEIKWRRLRNYKIDS